MSNNRFKKIKLFKILMKKCRRRLVILPYKKMLFNKSPLVLKSQRQNLRERSDGRQKRAEKKCYLTGCYSTNIIKLKRYGTKHCLVYYIYTYPYIRDQSYNKLNKSYFKFQSKDLKTFSMRKRHKVIGII